MKVLFVVMPHSVIDVITNSSTELFVGTSSSKPIMIEMVEAVYPDFRNEYEEIKTIEEISNEELSSFLNYHFNRWSNHEQRCVNEVVDGFTFDDMYEVSGSFSWVRDDFVENNRNKIEESLDPEKKIYFMFSYGDNPDWDYQQRLMDVMSRYHLG